MTFVDLMLNVARERETHCRTCSGELRSLADTERDADLRTRLLTLAERYEELGARVVHERESISALLGTSLQAVD